MWELRSAQPSIVSHSCRAVADQNTSHRRPAAADAVYLYANVRAGPHSRTSCPSCSPPTRRRGRPSATHRVYRRILFIYDRSVQIQPTFVAVFSNVHHPSHPCKWSLIWLNWFVMSHLRLPMTIRRIPLTTFSIEVEGEQSNKAMEVTDVIEFGSDETDLHDELPDHNYLGKDKIPRVGMRSLKNFMRATQIKLVL
ncbi:uncharacterized protein [Arachis hypogaea]|uniref:uncharacterized protein n=1 Tax=Arachis hypogaea TaxID=3818 RepID=UPI000DEC7497|nr:uncharacterized protein LOC112748265 [Arachis hypogaea]